jgi:hypothetical protein
MKLARRAFATSLALAVSGLLTGALAQSAADKITVYKTPSCGCCIKWVEHLRAAGFEVEALDSRNLVAERKRLGVPSKLAGCHTATVAGYAIEGHVPAEQIKRLLQDKPNAAGLSVPGMPIGSPGMEGPGGHDYDVLIFDRAGNTSVYATEKPLSN